MNKVTWKPSTLLSPVPAIMVSCGTMECSNILTIAWTGIVNTTPPMTYVSIRKQRHSHSIIKQSGEFVINLTTTNLIRAADTCGVKSGADIDKFKEMKLTKAESTQLSCPCIEESPLSIECRVKDIIELGSHDMFLAEIVAVNVSPEFIDVNGKLRLDKADLVAFAHGEYYELGKKVGSIGFSVQKKKPNKSRLKSKYAKK